MIFALTNLPQTITAVGGLGTAAFGVVDASKALWGGVNHIGFASIRTAVTKLTPAPSVKAPNALTQKNIVANLQANWFSGTDLNSQKAIAKSLVKLNLKADNASKIAEATGVDPVALTNIAMKIESGAALGSAESDVLARFDLIVTALLDEAYQRADQLYVNGTRALAMVVALVLAVWGRQVASLNMPEALLVGLLATPLAPMAKDLSSALASAVNSLRMVKK